MYINTTKDWNDLQINDQAKERLQDAGKVIAKKAGCSGDSYNLLFRGPAHSGKKTAASLLGKITGKPVFYIDLSKVVSKYIGETEKNLSKLFDGIKDDGAILFFDEADALFGRRTEVKDSHDKYANQEVSYFLKKLEENPVISILATGMDNYMHDSVAGRFHKVIHFHAGKIQS